MRAFRKSVSGSTLQVVLAPTSSRSELGANGVHNYAAQPKDSPEYPAILDSIRGAVGLVYDSEKSLVDNGVISPSQTNLIALEKHLLDLSAIDQATRGVFYMFVVGTENSKFVRFFESGSYVGFHHQHQGCDTFPASLTGHGYRVYTEEDIMQRSNRKTSMMEQQRANRPQVKRRNRLGQAYSRELGHIKKHIEVLKKIAADVRSKLQLCMFLHIVRNKADVNNPDHRYVHAFGINTEEQMYLERTLQDFRLDGASSYPTLETLASAASLPLPPLSMQNQLDVLSSLSNDPFQLYPTISGVMSQASSKVGHMRYISYQMPAGNEEDSCPNMLPASVRNRFIYFQSNNRVCQCRQLLKHVFPGNNSARVPCYAPNMALLQITPYENFRTKLVEVGCILWRLHTTDVDLFIMNEYTDGGEVIPNSFVDVEFKSRDGTVTCTCASYVVIHGIASNESPQADALPAGTLCMHCRFFREEIQPRLQSCIDETTTDERLPSVQQKIKDSRVFINDVVVPLTTSHGTRKYSVLTQTGSACAMVHVSATGTMATCTNGTCQGVQRHKRSVDGLLKLEDVSSICEHLAAMHANREVWAPRQVPLETVEEDEEVLLDDDSQNFDIPVLDQEMVMPTKFFQTDSGKWDFGGYSTHKPVEEYDHMKSRNIQARMAVYDGNPSYPRDYQTGLLKGMDLIPQIPDSNTCVCGSPFKNEQFPNGLPPVKDFTCTLYMRHAPVQCKVFYLNCLNKVSCHQPLRYSGLEHSVFLWSRQVAAGDEIGWDFINRVLTSKISFSAFCADITRVYKSVNVLSVPFMDESTFVSWFFAWCSRMDIDFRREIDPWCGYNPKHVAGDGSHIGIPLCHLSIVPVERADSDCVKTPKHKRFDRVFLHYREGIDESSVRKARKHLKDTAEAYLSRGLLDTATKDASDNNLLQACSQDDRCKDFLHLFLSGDMPSNFKQASAKFLLLLACDSAVTTVLPHRYHADIRAAVYSLLSQEGQLQSNFHLFCPELGHLMEESIPSQSHQCLANFILYLLDFMSGVHSQDEEPAPAVQIPSSYNPESGIAYYFTNHGNAVRRLPMYQINSTGNHDDQPCLDERCTKKVSLGGWTYLFLWFCPLHGHCYGFHMVQGAEGRKDPFSSLYRYMEEPPREVFYDFACSLSEYCLNREPKFFRNTRMWHDVFHGVTHLCGKNFKSQRLPFAGFSAEICEQFSSFIQCIKCTGTHLSQSHFTFFVQFMIYVWNKKKTATFMKKVQSVGQS